LYSKILILDIVYSILCNIPLFVIYFKSCIFHELCDCREKWLYKPVVSVILFPCLQMPKVAYTYYHLTWLFLSIFPVMFFLCPHVSGGHLNLPLSVRPSVRPSVLPSVRPSVCPSVHYCVARNSKSIWPRVMKLYRNVDQHV
jgi:hypothetical protein